MRVPSTRRPSWYSTATSTRTRTPAPLLTTTKPWSHMVEGARSTKSSRTRRVASASGEGTAAGAPDFDHSPVFLLGLPLPREHGENFVVAGTDVSAAYEDCVGHSERPVRTENCVGHAMGTADAVEPLTRYRASSSNTSDISENNVFSCSKSLPGYIRIDLHVIVHYI